MFDKILIANRGEIACRVIRSARRMGIRTVAIYSDADADALHVRDADEAVPLGPPASSKSYLNIDRIIEASRATGAQAVHPGYGFLSENVAFPAALAEAGIIFIGPELRAIAAMGDKIEAKKLAKAAGVSTIPGYLDVIADAESAIRIARDIGYPVMIKASAGGGGKGIRIARTDAEVRDGFRAAGNEARTSFADDRIFIERYIEEPRHVEIQVLGDNFGNIVYLGERECSIQRRHQKVIEEAPSPFLNTATRAAMGGQAVALARAVDYRSAGTVEFIVDRDGNFYFLEMNTRLQVEHPVTEMVTGHDIVELMIRIAAGERLPFEQKDVRPHGSAIEARIYAEDPLRNFLPSTGRITHYRPPTGDGIRVDTGVYEGAEISVYYDPMIAKLIAFGETRNTAIARLSAALDGFLIRGVAHNIPFLAALIAKKRFVAGPLTTNFIAEEFPDGFTGCDIGPLALKEAAAIAATLQYILAERVASIDGQIPGSRQAVPQEWVVCLSVGQRLPRRARREGEAVIVGDGDSEITVLTSWQPGQALVPATIGGAPALYQFERDGIGFKLTRGGITFCPKVLSPRAALLLTLMPLKPPPDTSRLLLSPMPGLLIALTVIEGQEVKAGDELALVEAMKMENVLRAERDGKVARIHAKQGDTLAVDQVILEFA